MKKLLILLLLSVSFLLSSPAFATIKYVDVVSGDDGTGDGSTGNPYQSISKADDGLSGGDEVRVKKTTVSTASNTMTWTNASVTVNTTADETGNIVVGDSICKTSDFTGTEGWWNVSAITSSAITLVAPYDGSTQTVTTYYLHDAATHHDTIGSSGTSTSSLLKITGGWDFTGPTRDGYTYFDPGSTTYSTITSASRYYLEFAYFVLTDSTASPAYYPLSFSNCHDVYIHHIFSVNNNSYFNISTSDYVTVEDVIATGPDARYSIYLYNVFMSTFENFTVHAQASAVYPSVYLNAVKVSMFINWDIYDSAHDGVELLSSAYGNYLHDVNVDGSDEIGVQFAQSCGNVISNSSITNNGTYGVYFNSTSTNNRVHSCTFSGNVTADISAYGTSELGSTRGTQVTSAGVHTNYTGKTTFGSDTTDARSGTCLKVTPTDVNEPCLPINLGTVKVASTATDLTLKIYLKDDASFNGRVWLMAVQDGEVVTQSTEKTPTTSYVEHSIVVASADLTLNKYIDLKVYSVGTAGSVFFDDFSWSQ